ncbi:histidine--tRNA ligase [Halobacillus campisalis]|uniref:Histidine--tRNA ligase n=1 Tax=Halobacillus campisalis TaxID=435909 RepID=A0ABW2K1U2_9BACI|nr:histidine--tRNA ligase [Halobacillus campisalis]
MKKMDYQNVKGTKDFLPGEEIVRRKVRRTLEDVFIQYGCQPLETPILNYTDLLASKYAGGAEILEEMYQLSDRGERELALRYDLTVPFAKAAAMNPSLKLPFKRYEIGKVFRDGPIKTGRLREFTQCDVDIVGVETQMGEAELMMMAADSFKKLEMNVTIEYNNRKLLNGLLSSFGIQADDRESVILTLDKLNKIEVKGVITELKEKQVSPQAISKIENFLNTEDNKEVGYFESYTGLNEELDQGIKELKELKGFIEYAGLQGQCIFNPFLARGLEIYSGTVYEIFIQGSGFTSSIGGGGRYDNAIGGLIGTEETFSTVGISFGLDAVCAAMKEGASSGITNVAVIDSYVIPLSREKEALLVGRNLREKGENVEVDLSGKKLNKAMKRANELKVRKVVIVGDDEVLKKQINIKDMESGAERTESFSF